MNQDSLVANKAFRAILLGVEDVVGKQGLATILQQAGLPQFINNYPPNDPERNGQKLSDIGKINHALFDIYGPRGSRAIMQRVGRGQAKFGLEANAALANAAKLAAKFFSRRHKTKFALDTAAKAVNEQLDTHVTISEDAQYFYYEAWNCAYCKGWTHDAAVCHAVSGFIHGIVAWALDSDEFQVQEISCRAKGDELCKFRVALNA
ncbi:MAG: 4-vinyl reductase [Chloroflexota bacterium]